MAAHHGRLLSPCFHSTLPVSFCRFLYSRSVLTRHLLLQYITCTRDLSCLLDRSHVALILDLIPRQNHRKARQVRRCFHSFARGAAVQVYHLVPAGNRQIKRQVAVIVFLGDLTSRTNGS